ncbi:hypothetical protein HY095_00125 [Candidatus Micrarchaeota archaeon]|nr:hypothetical protein [Candidatus Micrarchaeota archaeon]
MPRAFLELIHYGANDSRHIRIPPDRGNPNEGQLVVVNLPAFEREYGIRKLKMLAAEALKDWNEEAGKESGRPLELTFRRGVRSVNQNGEVLSELAERNGEEEAKKYKWEKKEIFRIIASVKP